MKKKVAILGFGVEGKDAASFFLKKGADVTVFDQKNKKDLGFTIKDLRLNNIKWMLGKNYLREGLSGFDTIVRSPGFYRFHPKIIEAEKAGVEITSNTNIFFTECKKPIIAVTGTKGKGTVVRMLALALKEAGLKTLVAGNIGEPMLKLLPKANQADWVVLELSSFQTIDLDRSPKICVVTNITVDHLNWHKNREKYVKAKEQLWKNQIKEDFLILNRHDKTSINLAGNARAQVVWFNTKGAKLPGSLQVSGRHNRENAMAALKTAEAVGSNLKKAWQGITSYQGSEHRLEKVGTFNGITYINDSASTNPESTIAALQSIKEPKILIAGGSSKGVKFSSLARAITKGNVKAVLLMGETENEIESVLKKAKYKGYVEKAFKSMKALVDKSKKLAESGNVVLLSPGCASFGMFANYEERGGKFKQAVAKLTQHCNSHKSACFTS